MKTRYVNKKNNKKIRKKMLGRHSGGHDSEHISRTRKSYGFTEYAENQQHDQSMRDLAKSVEFN